MGAVMKRRRARRLAPLALLLPVAVGIAVPAGAETVAVDPGKATSAGKPITGSGQNLPSMNAAAIWDIGGYSASTITTYYTSGEADRDRADVTRAALRWTRDWVRAECGSTTPAKVRACKAAAVFDVDDTLVNWQPILSALPQPYTYDSAVSDAAIAACTTPVQQATKKLYRALQTMGVTTFLITGRPESQRQQSAACLESLGISGWKKFILRAPGDDRPASVYKSTARRALERQGWRIGPSVGDQVSDMSLGHLGAGFLVPNVMYFIP